METVSTAVQIIKEVDGGGAAVRSGCGVGENVGVLHGVGVLRHRHHAPALWLRSEV